MKIISKKEATTLLATQGMRGEGFGGLLWEPLRLLEIGEFMKVEKSDWGYRAHPSTHLSAYFRGRNKKFKVRTLKDGSGWLIERIA